MCQERVGANLMFALERITLSFLWKTRKISSPFIYVPARCRGEPYVRPRTNNAFVPMYDGRTQGSPLHVLGT